MNPPTTDPAPSAARIPAHAPAPPREVFATNAPSTTNTDDIMLPIDAATTITHTQVRDANSRHPSWRSLRNDCGGSVTCAGRRSCARKYALTAKLAASRASAQPAPTPATSAPEMTEPMMPVDAIESPRSAFACCRRSGLTVIGVSPVDAGLKNALAVPE